MMIQVQEKNDLFEALEAAADGALAIGPDGRVLLWNQAAERLLGYTTAEALGRSCCDLLGGQAAGERVCDCTVRTAASGGQAVESFDMRARTKTGQPVWLNVSTLSLRRVGDGESVTIHLFRATTSTLERPAVAPALAPRPAPVPASVNGGLDSGESLTRREREVLRLLATGANTRVLAERLTVSPATIRNHVQNLFGKLGVHSRLEAVAYATANRLV